MSQTATKAASHVNKAGKNPPSLNDNRYQTVQAKLNSQQEQLPIQKAINNTGLSDNLKSGIENLSGYSMDDVKVHYNSSKPAQLQAHAYAQGNEIHLSPGQEKHLPHEAWHVVQQKQGRVKSTTQLKGEKINNDSTLEKEADIIGDKALSLSAGKQSGLSLKPSITSPIIQGKFGFEFETGIQMVNLKEAGAYTTLMSFFSGTEEVFHIDKDKRSEVNRITKKQQSSGDNVSEQEVFDATSLGASIDKRPQKEQDYIEQKHKLALKALDEAKVNLTKAEDARKKKEVSDFDNKLFNHFKEEMNLTDSTKETEDALKAKSKKDKSDFDALKTASKKGSYKMPAPQGKKFLEKKINLESLIEDMDIVRQKLRDLRLKIEIDTYNGDNESGKKAKEGNLKKAEVEYTTLETRLKLLFDTEGEKAKDLYFSYKDNELATQKVSRYRKNMVESGTNAYSDKNIENKKKTVDEKTKLLNEAKSKAQAVVNMAKSPTIMEIVTPPYDEFEQGIDAKLSTRMGIITNFLNAIKGNSTNSIADTLSSLQGQGTTISSQSNITGTSDNDVYVGRSVEKLKDMLIKFGLISESDANSLTYPENNKKIHAQYSIGVKLKNVSNFMESTSSEHAYKPKNVAPILNSLMQELNTKLNISEQGIARSFFAVIVMNLRAGLHTPNLDKNFSPLLQRTDLVAVRNRIPLNEQTIIKNNSGTIKAIILAGTKRKTDEKVIKAWSKYPGEMTVGEYLENIINESSDKYLAKKGKLKKVGIDQVGGEDAMVFEHRHPCKDRIGVSSIESFSQRVLKEAKKVNGVQN